MSEAIVKTAPVALRAVQAFEFTPEQRKMILDTYLNGATEEEAAVLMELAKLKRLNPIAGQIHFVKRYDKRLNDGRGGFKWSAQVGIDGFRAKAEETGRYDGQDEPEFEYDAKGALKLARVRVYRKDISRPFVGVAHFSEYVQTTRDGKPNSMWEGKPHIMLAKCAEALAMRKAFPDELSGLYSPEEMPQEERELNPAPKQQTKTQTIKEKLAAKIAAPQDAPPQEDPPEEVNPETGEVAGAVVPFGKNAGTLVADLTDKQLSWYIERAEEKNETEWLETLRAEVERRK